MPIMIYYKVYSQNVFACTSNTSTPMHQRVPTYRLCSCLCVCVRGRESSDRQPRASRLAQAAGLGTLYKAAWKLENITLAWYFAEGETACL